MSRRKTAAPMIHCKIKTVVSLFFVCLAWAGIYPVFGAPADSKEFKISIIAPAVIFPEGKEDGPKLIRFVVSADELASSYLSNCVLFLNDQKTELTPNRPPKKPETNTVYAELSGTLLEVWLPWSPFNLPWPGYHGKVTARLMVSDELSEPAEIVIASVEASHWPVAIALLVSLVILLLPLAIIQMCGSKYTVDDKSYGLWKSLFLDKETDTYSLSKFQFYAWTAAAVIGYLVLTLARSLVQGRLEFADIPDGLPGILLASAATTTVAQGITSVKGAKGSGSVHPCWSDFITSGGIVAAERFQFFVWTIVGVVTFLFLVLSSDPATLDTLPKIPTGFLALMGVSSAGYLGGKLARKPGPIIDEITATVGSLILTIRGRKLSRYAGFRVGGKEVKSTELVVTASEPDGESQPTEFYRTLTVSISTPDAAWLAGGKHPVSLINPDGQEAQWPYALPSKPSMTKVTPFLVGTALKLIIEGAQLSSKPSLKIGQIAVPAVFPAAELPEGESAEFYRRLSFTIANPTPDWIQPGKPIELSLTNPDGQSASATYRFSNPSMSKVTPSVVGQLLSLVIDGAELSKEIRVKIDEHEIREFTVSGEVCDAAFPGLCKQFTLEIPKADASFISAGTSKALTLTNPDGQSAKTTYP